MTELRDRPAIRGMALRTILTEKIKVPIVIGVACRAVQCRFEGTDLRMRCFAIFCPSDEFILEPFRLAVGIVVAQLTPTDGD